MLLKNPGDERRLSLDSRDWVLAAFLFFAVLLAYQPAWNGKPIWDDNAHLIPPSLRSVEGLERIWFQPGTTQQYYPLVSTVFWVEQKLWDNAWLGYHVVNIIFHLASALLILKILRLLEVPGAWLGAALWALHPVQVESVAWMTEMKNTLSSLCYLGSALAYLLFDRKREGGYYVASLALFAAGLFAKSVIATLPAALLLVFWWKRNKLRWKEDVLPLGPFFIAGIGMGLFTAWYERTMLVGMDRSYPRLSAMDRFLIPPRAVWFYLGKLAWPHPLIFIYPRWVVSGAVWWQFLFPAAALLLLAGLWCFRGSLGRGPLVALLFFAGTLFPAIGFFNVYPFRYSFVADHFQYLACLGPLALVAAGIESGSRSAVLKPFACAGLLAILGALTWMQCGQYADVETLWRTTLARNPGCWMAHDNLGHVLDQKGDAAGAIAEYQKTLQFEPHYAEGYNDLGNALGERGELQQAIADYRQALDIKPDFSIARFNLGNALIKEGDIAGAIAQYQQGLRLRPNDFRLNVNLANAFFTRGNLDAAIAQYRQALKSAPDTAPGFSDAEDALGLALFQSGQTREAIGAWNRALAIKPGMVKVENRLAWVLATASDPALRDSARAVALAEEANQLTHGRDPIILCTLAAAYAETKRYTEASALSRKALNQAELQKNDGLAAALQEEIKRFDAGLPMREEK